MGSGVHAGAAFAAGRASGQAAEGCRGGGWRRVVVLGGGGSHEPLNDRMGLRRLFVGGYRGISLGAQEAGVEASPSLCSCGRPSSSTSGCSSLRLWSGHASRPWPTASWRNGQQPCLRDATGAPRQPEGKLARRAQQRPRWRARAAAVSAAGRSCTWGGATASDGDWGECRRGIAWGAKFPASFQQRKKTHTPYDCWSSASAVFS